MIIHAKTFTAYADNLQCQLMLKAYRYLTSMGRWTSDARRTFFKSSASIHTTLKRVTVQTSTIRDDGRGRAKLDSVSPGTRYRTVWRSSRWTLVSDRLAVRRRCFDRLTLRRRRVSDAQDVEMLLEQTAPRRRLSVASKLTNRRGWTSLVSSVAVLGVAVRVLAAGRHERLISSSAPTSLSPPPRPRYRWNRWHNDVIHSWRNNDIIMQNEPIGKLV